MAGWQADNVGIRWSIYIFSFNLLILIITRKMYDQKSYLAANLQLLSHYFVPYKSCKRRYLSKIWSQNQKWGSYIFPRCWCDDRPLVFVKSKWTLLSFRPYNKKWTAEQSVSPSSMCKHKKASALNTTKTDMIDSIDRQKYVSNTNYTYRPKDIKDDKLLLLELVIKSVDRLKCCHTCLWPGC